MYLLEAKNIRKSFGELNVLKNISLSVSESEVVSIIGPSGSGKSTFLRILSMLETVDGGSITCLLYTSSEEQKQQSFLSQPI